MAEQLTIWTELAPKLKINKPVRLIELFAGIGSQFKALKELAPNVESYKICEWAYPSYCAYNAIHIKDFTDYSKDKTLEECLEKIQGTSTDYNKPLAIKQLKAKGEERIRNAYNNIIATHNLVDITQVKGEDLAITETDKYIYIMTYSFPCQDLSLAGQLKGMSKDSGTRSGLLWEVERLLEETKVKPQILLMENVPEVIGQNNLSDFQEWVSKLSQLGYSNFYKVLNAKDYGIPQNRRRCFMISILGDYAYEFPRKTKLKYCLEDFLEKNVDKKYFLSQRIIDFFLYNTEKQKENGNGFKFEPHNVGNTTIARTISTRSGSRMDDNFISYESLNYYNHDQSNRVYDPKGLAPTIRTGSDDAKAIKIKNNTLKGYEIAEKGDGINISGRMQKQRGNVQKGLCQTLKTSCEVGVIDEQPEQTNIRKLTETECMRLMGFEDKDTQAIKDIGMKQTSIYHCAGDSIVVPCLIALFSEFFNEQDKHIEIIDNYVERVKN